MDRETFLARVRQSLDDVTPGPRPSPYQPPPTPERSDLTDRLRHAVTAVGGTVTVVTSKNAARAQIRKILESHEAKQVLRGDTPLIRQLDLDDFLHQSGIAVTVATLDQGASPDSLRSAAFLADVGITSVDFAVAETGTLAVLAEPSQGRAVSLLPPVHLAVLDSRDIVLELAALFDRVEQRDSFERVEQRGALPSALTFITGPSLTGDIEQKLTVGVHGPGELHVVVLDESG